MHFWKKLDKDTIILYGICIFLLIQAMWVEIVNIGDLTIKYDKLNELMTEYHYHTHDGMYGRKIDRKNLYIFNYGKD